MEQEQPKSPEERTTAFFDRPSIDVAQELSERVYLFGLRKGQFPKGDAKTILISTPEGEKRYKITVTEPYAEEGVNRVWKGTRLQKIRSLQPGEVIAFQYRAAILSFIKTVGGGNILIREIEDEESQEKTKSPTQVSQKLGLAHGQEGRLVYQENDVLEFRRK